MEQLTFKKMKPFKLFVEFHMGINEASVKLIERGCKNIDKKGHTSIMHTSLTLLVIPAPMHISG